MLEALDDNLDDVKMMAFDAPHEGLKQYHHDTVVDVQLWQQLLDAIVEGQYTPLSRRTQWLN